MQKKLSNILSKGKRGLRRRGPAPDSGEELAVPRITNETLAAHREEVLRGARKYIYPLQHSKHRVVLISSGVFIASVVTFFTYVMLSLYRFQSTSPFIYNVSRVIPFPIARAGSSFVAYENYLFELRHYMHYYETQQKLSFESDAGREQLNEFKKRALDRVVNDAYVKKLARENNVTVSNQEVDEQIELLRSQNRLGNNDKVFEDVLKDFWGWSLADFKRSLRQQLLAQKVAATLDTDTRPRAEIALADIRAGKDFAQAAREYSDDTGTKEGGGEFGILIEKNNRDVPAQTVDALFKLQPGQVSDIVNIGYALQIVKNLEFQGDKVRGAHIVFNFQDISRRLNDEKDKHKTRLYIGLPAAPAEDAPVSPEGSGSATQPVPGTE